MAKRDDLGLLRSVRRNAAHPFREGNGRTQRAFLRQLAREAGWNLRWSKVTSEENTGASEASMMGDNGPLETVRDRSLESRS